jgi:hypothetical protein
MKTLKSVVCTLAIVVSATVVSLSQNNVVAENNSDANKVFLWTSNYMKAFPTEAYAHIGGKIAIKEFLNTKGMEKILVFNGIDSEGSHKVIFKAAYENGLPIEDTDTYDNIRPCPPYCPKEKIAEIGSVIDEGLAFQMIEKFQRNYTSRPKAQLFDKEVLKKYWPKTELKVYTSEMQSIVMAIKL